MKRCFIDIDGLRRALGLQQGEDDGRGSGEGIVAQTGAGQRRGTGEAMGSGVRPAEVEGEERHRAGEAPGTGDRVIFSQINSGSGSTTITVNGKTYTGRSVSIINGVVTIDGKAQDGTVSGVVEVRVEGGLADLRTDASVTCQNVAGSIDAGGSVNVKGAVVGDIDAGGSVNVGGNVSGGIDAGGSVRTG